MRGYFAIGIWGAKYEVNLGTLWRSAHVFGASFIFTVGARYRKRQASDVTHAPNNLPLFAFTSLDDLCTHLPYGCPLIAVETEPDARPLPTFTHPRRACYLLGAEDHGLSWRALARCHATVSIPDVTHCLNVATAGSIVLYDRAAKASLLRRELQAEAA